MVAPKKKTVRLTCTPEQYEFIRHPATMKVLTCGRRWGKSRAAKDYLVDAALRNPGQESSYIGKTYKLAFKTFRAITQHKALKPLIRAVRQQPSPMIEWRNGHVTWLFSADRPDNLRGDGLVLCIIDEAAYADERLVVEIIMPAMLDNNGTLVLMSTFRGTNFYYQWHEKGKTYPNADDCKSWLYPTPTGIWAQGEAGKVRLERLKSRLPSTVWKQECLCDVSANLSAVFPGDLLARATRGTVRGPQIGFGYIVSYDSGKQDDPPSIVVIECREGSDAIAVVHVETLPLETDYPAQVARVKFLARMYKASVMVDSTGAGTKDAIVDFVKREAQDVSVYPIQLRGDLPQNLVNRALWMLEKDLIAIPAACSTLLHQLRQFEYEHLGDGDKYKYGVPRPGHDDEAWALMMAIEGARMRRFSVLRSVVPVPPPGSQGWIFHRQRNPPPPAGRL